MNRLSHFLTSNLPLRNEKHAVFAREEGDEDSIPLTPAPIAGFQYGSNGAAISSAVGREPGHLRRNRSEAQRLQVRSLFSSPLDAV